MPRLSQPLGSLRSAYDVVVVGSGYGGAVAACRLAQGGLDVCVLERGHEFEPGDFPGNATQALRQLQIDFPRMRLGRRTGLFDFRVNDDLSVLVGCGLGGTSLINANAMVRPLGLDPDDPDDPDPGILGDDAWPEALRRDRRRLLSGYDEARAMLAGRAYPAPGRSTDAMTDGKREAWGRFPLPGKLAVLERAAGREKVQLPLLAVSFDEHVSEDGIQRRACVLCGDCVTGCNHSAKNTLDTNYLARARRYGAAIVCGAEVRSVEPADGQPADVPPALWNVWFRPDAPRGWSGGERPEMFVSARVVVLAAGSLGSTDILLRSRARTGLPLSDQIGERFTGNGDVIAFAYNNDPLPRRNGRDHPDDRDELNVHGIGHGNRRLRRLEPVGPTITGMIDERSHDEEPPGMLIEEGAIPGALAPLLRWFAPIITRISGRDTDSGPRDRVREWIREFRSMLLGPRRGALANTQTYLVMAWEKGSGRITRRRDRVRVAWRGLGHQPVFRAVHRRLRRLTERTGGTHVMNPFWTRLAGRRLLTVHPLGGCCMAEDGAAGVVNDRGQVFTGPGTGVYDNLLVLDGSIVPMQLGANPLWTIAALAERACAMLLVEPPAGVWPNPPANGPPPLPPARPATVGIQFSERVTGHLHEEDGRRTRFRLRLVIEAPDLDAFLEEPPERTSDKPAAQREPDDSHKAMAFGFGVAPALSDRPLTVTTGRFNLFAKDPRWVETRIMRYRLKLRATDGREFELDGRKTIQGFAPFRDVIRSLFEMEFELHEVTGGGRVRVGDGRLRISPLQVVRTVFAVRILRRRRLRDAVTGRLRFLLFFARAIWRAAAWPLRSARPIDPDVERPASKLRRPKNAYGIEVAPFARTVTTDDGAEILLTRYDGGENGPVILAPGFGTSTLLFRISTIRPNLVEYLVGHGYDVWLLDYRASDRSASSRTQFTMDQIVRQDLPLAVRVVAEETGKRPQYVGHCVASVAMFMALLSGEVTELRSMIGSQFFPFVYMPWQNRVKSALRIAEMLEFGGFAPVLTPDFDRYRPLHSRLVDRLLYFYPSRERCRSPVCRRTLFLYGENYQHRLLDSETHDAIFDMFDRANLRTFKHLTRMCRARRAVDHEGRNRYLTEDNAKKLELPITLLQGQNNYLFLPEGSRRMHAWLLEHGAWGPGPGGRQLREEAYRLVTFEDFGHMDTFMGRDSARIVFPEVLAGLQEADRFLSDRRQQT